MVFHNPISAGLAYALTAQPTYTRGPVEHPLELDLEMMQDFRTYRIGAHRPCVAGVVVPRELGHVLHIKKASSYL